MRESKEHTTWVATDQAYEDRVLALARATLAAEEGALATAIRQAVADSAGRIRALTLAQKLLQLALPGVPDTYQGTELVDLSLVDPDNRRPVDFADRRQRLARLDGGAAPQDLSDEKLLVTATALRLRRERPASFAGDLTLLEVGEELLAYQRNGDVLVLATRAPAADGTVPDRPIELPAGTWTDRLTGVSHTGPVTSDEVLARLPVALLVRS